MTLAIPLKVNVRSISSPGERGEEEGGREQCIEWWKIEPSKQCLSHRHSFSWKKTASRFLCLYSHRMTCEWQLWCLVGRRPVASCMWNTPPVHIRSVRRKAMRHHQTTAKELYEHRVPVLTTFVFLEIARDLSSFITNCDQKTLQVSNTVLQALCN